MKSKVCSRLCPTLGLLGLLAVFLPGCGGITGSSTGSSKIALGKALFNDTTLSNPVGQSCGSCHQAGHAFTDPRQDVPTSEGAVAGLFGNRQTPSVAYLAFSPLFHYDDDEEDYIGGQFWDGRADDLKDQVHFPMLNPAEMNNPNIQAIADKVKNGPNAFLLRQVYGSNVFDTPEQTMTAVADAIAAFESSFDVNRFSSKYDAYLRGKATLSAAEERGLALFNGKAGCNNCHPSSPSDDGTPPLFTDFTYDNIGLPSNPANPFYSMPPNINPDGAGFHDIGLQKTTNRPDDVGRFKVPTLRNIAATAPYFHNGVATTLEDAVQFYNKRDLGFMSPPEFPDNMNTEELGDLGLTNEEVADLVEFLKTLTDGYMH